MFAASCSSSLSHCYCSSSSSSSSFYIGVRKRQAEAQAAAADTEHLRRLVVFLCVCVCRLRVRASQPATIFSCCCVLVNPPVGRPPPRVQLEHWLVARVCQRARNFSGPKQFGLHRHSTTVALCTPARLTLYSIFFSSTSLKEVQLSSESWHSTVQYNLHATQLNSIQFNSPPHKPAT